jgi:hypothetical protein
MKIRYVSYKKEFPDKGIGISSFTDWFRVRRYWKGKLILISIKHHEIVIDMRGDLFDEMTNK